MPRETWTAPAIFPVFSTSGASRTSTSKTSPLAIISRACAGVRRGTEAFAASIICLTLVVMAILPFCIKSRLLRAKAKACRRKHTNIRLYPEGLKFCALLRAKNAFGRVVDGARNPIVSSGRRRVLTGADKKTGAEMLLTTASSVPGAGRMICRSARRCFSLTRSPLFKQRPAAPALLPGRPAVRLAIG